VIFVAENSNRLKNTKFWKENSVEDVVTFECLAFNSSRRNYDVPLVLWKDFDDLNLMEFVL